MQTDVAWNTQPSARTAQRRHEIAASARDHDSCPRRSIRPPLEETFRHATVSVLRQAVVRLSSLTTVIRHIAKFLPFSSVENLAQLRLRNEAHLTEQSEPVDKVAGKTVFHTIDHRWLPEGG